MAFKLYYHNYLHAPNTEYKETVQTHFQRSSHAKEKKNLLLSELIKINHMALNFDLKVWRKYCYLANCL